MRSLRLLSLITISLLTTLLSAILLAQSSSSITDAVIKAPLVKQSAAVKDVSQPDPASQAKIREGYGKLPLSFEANQGQADSQVKFLTRTGAYSMFLTRDEAVLVLREPKAKNKNKDKGKDDKDKFSVETRLAASPAKANSTPTPERATERSLRMKLRNANPAAKITGTDELAGTSNYFIGNDPAKWRTNVQTYSKVKYEGIYSGIDLIFYGNQRQLEYDFIVAPGVDPHRIAFDISGAKQIRKDEQGDLVFKTGEGEIRWHKPVAYQEKDGTRQLVAACYAITDKNRVGFELAKYDAGRPLYIDPLIYSTYLGGSSDDIGLGIALDSAGNAYVTGRTSSTDFPTKNPLQTANGGGDAFVTKINAAGSALVYSTYLGGKGSNNYGTWDKGSSIAVDSTGSAYITGLTNSPDFPVTPGAFQTVCAGGGFYGGCVEAFVTKINPAGSALVYSSFLGGSDTDGYLGGGIAVDSAGNAYVTGNTWSADFPTTPGAFQTLCGRCRFAPPQHGDAFVSKVNPTGSALIYSSYLGGDLNYGAVGYGIVIDSAGNAYVTGETDSPDFPVTPGGFQTACASGCDDAFVSKINPAGSALVYSTYLGGSGVDQGAGIAVDGTGNAYVTGGGSADFPVTPGAFQTVCAGGCAFVTKLNQAGSALAYSTYLGGDGDHGQGIALDGAGNVYVTGAVFSFNFPVKHPLQPAKVGPSSNGFVAKLNPSGSDLVYSTYLGGSPRYIGRDQGSGIAVDSSDRAYVTGFTNSFDFPTKNPLQPGFSGPFDGLDAFVAKITRNPSDVTLFPLHLDYGHQPIGIGSSPQVSSLINASNATLAVTSINIAGTNSGDFAQTNNCGTSVPAGQSCSISVTFTPTAKGTRIATVSITDGAPDSPEPFSLSGVGTFDTATTLISSVNPSGLGKPVTFTATVSSPSGGTPTGTILFRDGGRELAAVNLFGTATFRTSKLSLGLHVMTASYQGNPDFGPSTSAPVNQYVLPATNTSLTSSLNPSTYGQPVILTAVVTASNGPPPDGEPVTFLDGNKVVGTGTLHNGSATFSTSALRVGTNYMTALYGGDVNLAGSRSVGVKQVVSKATTTTTLASSQNPSTVGQSVTFTAKVTPQFASAVTGSVSFFDGTTALKTAPLSGGVVKFTTSTLTTGSHTITATYNGNTNFDGSSASLTQTVN
jgi:hypothetical protein